MRFTFESEENEFITIFANVIQFQKILQIKPISSRNSFKKNCLNETVLACDIGNKCVYLPEEFAAAIKNEEQLRELNKAPRTMIYSGRAPRSLR